MSVVNISPESFFSGSYVPDDRILTTAERMIAQGADMIDIGARSTAPGSSPISVGTETERVITALKTLEGSGIITSLDTMHPEVLQAAMRYDIHAANDISGLKNPKMAKIIADNDLPAILMASFQAPGDCLSFSDTLSALKTVTNRATDADIDSYILDPGIGRWIPDRTPESDFELCQRFAELRQFNRPLLAAVSRKSCIGSATGREPEGRLAGTLAVTTYLVLAGASIIRSHDVPETRDLIQVIASIQEA